MNYLDLGKRFIVSCIAPETARTFPFCIRECGHWFQQSSILNNINTTTENDALTVDRNRDCFCESIDDMKELHLLATLEAYPQSDTQGSYIVEKYPGGTRND